MYTLASLLVGHGRAEIDVVDTAQHLRELASIFALRSLGLAAHPRCVLMRILHCMGDKRRRVVAEKDLESIVAEESPDHRQCIHPPLMTRNQNQPRQKVLNNRKQEWCH